MILKIFCVFLFLISGANGIKRKLNVTVNPDCVFSCNNTLLYIRATSHNDSLHYMWDFTYKPSVLIVTTEVNTILKYHWKSDIVLYVEKTGKVFYSYGIVLNKFIEFNETRCLDAKNKSGCFYKEYNSESILWEKINLKNNNGEISLLMASKNGSLPGTLNLKLYTIDQEHMDETLPHLWLSGNNSVIEVELKKFNTKFENSRFAVQIILISDEDKNCSLNIQSIRSVDDEYSPGVFYLSDLQMPITLSGRCGGYLQWRPLAYTSVIKDFSSSTPVSEHAVVPLTKQFDIFDKTILKAFYLEKMFTICSVVTHMSFGNEEEGVYSETEYLTWSFIVGYGNPYEESLSLTVALIIGNVLVFPVVIGFGALSFQKLKLYFRSRSL